MSLNFAGYQLNGHAHRQVGWQPMSKVKFMILNAQ
jgi:hypothetical protein